MISMNYRFHNARAHAAIINRKAILERQRANFKNAKHYTEVPFSGPNYKGNCKPHCEDILGTTKDMDRRMYKIIETYEKSQREATSKMARSKLSESKCSFVRIQTFKSKASACHIFSQF